MLLIPIIVSVSVFAVVALLLLGASKRSTPPEAVRATLESALRNVARPTRDEVVDLRKRTSLSSIPWLNRLLARLRPAAELRRILEQADLAWTPGRVISTSVAVWMVAAYAVRIITGVQELAPLLAIPAASAPILYVFHKRQRRFARFQEKLPDAIDLMVSALRAGNSTMGALGTVASDAPEPIRREFRICFDEQSYGVDIRMAMDNLLSRIPLPDLRIITTAILIQKESGGNLAEILDKTAHVIRDRFRLRDQIRVHSAQGRMTGWILAALPIAMLALLSILNPTYTRVLFIRPLGHKLLIGGLVSNILGLLLIRKIVRITL